MRIKTRSGFPISIPDGSVVKQEKIVNRHEVYYVLHMQDGRTVSTSDPVPEVSIKVVKAAEPPLPIFAQSTFVHVPLMNAMDCPSAGGAMNAAKPLDEHAGEKVKGETFFTHKTSPGLVIKSPKGAIIHETKMSDMYKRRD